MSSANRPRFLFAAVFITAILANSVFADAFDFSYNFANQPVTVTGTLTGTQNGNFVTDVNVTSLIINGYSVSGTIYTSQYAQGLGWINSGQPIVSFDGSFNNFGFITSDVTIGDYNNNDGFYMITFNGVHEADAYHFGGGSNVLVTDAPSLNANWSLTKSSLPQSTSSVPDSGATLAMVGGLFLTLAAFRRRIAA